MYVEEVNPRRTLLIEKRAISGWKLVNAVVFNDEGADLNPAPSVLSLRIVQSIKNFRIDSHPRL
jgi:hypothetical protein